MRRRVRERGFTLVELLITAALLVLVVSVGIGTLNRSQAEAERSSRLSEARQSARAAVQLLERDVRGAGPGWGGTPVVVSFQGTADTIFAVTPGPGAGSGSDDSLVILGARALPARLTASMPTPSSILQVDDVTGFAAGDVVVIRGGGSAHLFEVTGVAASSRRLHHHASSAWNPPGGFSPWPPGGYGADARVFKASMISYRVDSTSFRRRALVRRAFRGPAEVVAYDIDRFQVWYRMQDGSVTRAPALGAGAAVPIDRIRPVLHTRVTDRWSSDHVDSAWAEVQPRTMRAGDSP